MVVEILQQVVYGTPSGTSSSCTSRAGSYGSGIHAGVSRSGAASQPSSSYGGSNPGAPGLGSGLFGSGPGTLAIYSSKDAVVVCIVLGQYMCQRVGRLKG